MQHEINKLTLLMDLVECAHRGELTLMCLLYLVFPHVVSFAGFSFDFGFGCWPLWHFANAKLSLLGFGHVKCQLGFSP